MTRGAKSSLRMTEGEGLAMTRGAKRKFIKQNTSNREQVLFSRLPGLSTEIAMI
jgi:hypothetical protein